MTARRSTALPAAVTFVVAEAASTSVSSRTSEDGTTRRLSDRQARTVAGLLDAAIVEVRSNGYENVSVRSVAAVAGVAPATAYNYFSSKDHLVAEIYWRRLRELDDTASGVSASDVVGGRVAGALRAITMLVADDPPLAAACTVALLAPDPEVRRLRDRIGAEVHRRILAALGTDPPDGVVDALELTYSGALLRVGMGHLDYHEMADRLDAVVSIVCPAAGGTDTWEDRS